MPTFYDLKKIECIHPLFHLLEQCRGVRQNLEHHPEGDVFNHSLQVLHIAMRESDDLDLIFAGMLHDVGKAVGRLGHDQYGVKLLAGKASNRTIWIVGQHMRFWTFITGEMRRLGKVRDMVNHPWFSDLALVCRWDKMGKNPNCKIQYDRVHIIERLQKIQNTLEHTNLQGDRIQPI